MTPVPAATTTVPAASPPSAVPVRRPASRAQLKALFGIARARGVNLHQFVHDRFEAARPDELTVEEASRAIDLLKRVECPDGDHAA